MADPPFFSRESTIRRDAYGRWFHDGEPVTNEAIARAFDRWVDRAEDGRYRLKNSINWVYVEIEGPPIFVQSAHVEGDRMILELSDDQREPLDESTLAQDAAGVLTCTVRNGAMPAAFTRKAQAMLEPLVAEDEEGVYLAIDQRRVRPR